MASGYSREGYVRCGGRRWEEWGACPYDTMSTVLKNLCFILRNLCSSELYYLTSGDAEGNPSKCWKIICVCAPTCILTLINFSVYFTILVLQCMCMTHLYKMLYFISVYL